MTEQNPEDVTPPEETTPEQPSETTPEEQQDQTPEERQAEETVDEPKGERVTRLGVEYEVTPEHGHRRVG